MLNQDIKKISQRYLGATYQQNKSEETDKNLILFHLKLNVLLIMRRIGTEDVHLERLDIQSRSTNTTHAKCNNTRIIKIYTKSMKP